MLNLVTAPRFDQAEEQTADQVAADQASLREYQRSRGYQVPMGVELAEAGIDLSYCHVPDPILFSGEPTPTQVYEIQPNGQENRIASVVLGSQTCALDQDGNPLPL